MNVTLWFLQILLALWNMIGGSYTIFHYEILKSTWANDLPQAAWVTLGVLQVLFALALIIPKFSPVGAVYLTINALLGCALFAKYAGFPGMLWGLVPAILTAFVAYGRLALRPF